MRCGTPGGRPTTPIPRKPRPPLLLHSRKNEASPVPQRRSSVTCGAVSPTKAVVFKRIHQPVVESAALPEDTLRALRHTRSLFLCCRDLLSFSHIRYLEHMTQISSLNVHMNSISRIECLGHLQHLTELDVSANELRAVDEDAFKGLHQLKRLNLSSNFLTTVSGFQHLPALEWLSLSFNELQSVQGLRRLPCPQELLHLDICGNRIATLAELEDSLENCRCLQDLRVETPKAALVLPTMPPQLQLRENPFCAAEPNYAERLLQRMQRLVLLNGVPCGCDPTADALQRRHTASASRDESLERRPLDFTSSIVITAPHVAPCKDVLVNTYAIDESVACAASSTTGASSSSNNTSGACPSSPQWREKHVSRGVVTEVSIPPYKELLHVAGVEEAVRQKELQAKDELIEHLELKFMRAQEQLALRAALEEDLRRNFEDVRQTHATLLETSAEEKKRLCRQVAALKDELSRRSEEAAILQRRNRVELEEQTNALRAELVRQKKETAAAVRRMGDEVSRARKTAHERVTELDTKLHDAVRQNEWLEQQNEKAEAYVNKWKSESQSERAALLACERRLHLFGEQHHLQLEELAARRQLESVACSNILAAAAVHIGVLRREGDSLHLRWRNHQRAWEEYTAALQQHYQEALLKLQMVQMAPPVRVDVGCDPIDAHAHCAEEAEVQRLQTALSVAQQSEQLLSRENDRLLVCVGNKERELAEAAQQLQESEGAARTVREALERERDNLVRTLHNLRGSIEKKNAAFDELEAEAKLKIDEKRSIIARLEARLDDEEDAAAKKLRRAEEDLRRLKTELHAAQQARAEETSPSQPQQHQLTELLSALEDSKQKLAASMVREHQQSLKLGRAAEALSLLRGQLARVDEANSRLTKVISEKEAALCSAETERRQLQAQWQEAQEATRVRQRATLQALSQIMMDGNDGEA